VSMTAVADGAEPRTRCPSCDSKDLHPFYEVSGVPAHSCILLPTREEAVACPIGDVRLEFCPTCGVISNTRFDPTSIDYSHDYEETQGFSPRFRSFALELAERLVDRYDLHGKDVLEIGCGKGEFLALMCTLGGNRGLGIDPSFVPERVDPAAASTMHVLRESFSPKHVDVETDLLCCRHTLEHIPDVGAFMRLVAQVMRNRARTPAFFEVPDVRRVLREVAFWDIYHEHCSYFSAGSLARLFRGQDMRPVHLGTGFDDQYLLIDAVVAGTHPGRILDLEETIDALAIDVEHFRRRHRSVIDGWRERIGGLHRDGRRIVLWGSGSKAVAFLTTLGLEREVDCVVDVNPFRHGMYMAGTGQPIVSPGHLAEHRPDVVVVMNPIYRKEIEGELARMGITAEVLVLEPAEDPSGSATTAS